MASALVFLRMNGLRTDFPEFEAITLAVAAGRMNEDQVAEAIRTIYRNAGLIL